MLRRAGRHRRGYLAAVGGLLRHHLGTAVQQRRRFCVCRSGTAAGACRHRPGECGCALFRSVHRCRGSCAHRPFRGRHRLPQVCREPAAHHHRPPYIVPECTAGHGQLGFFRRDHPAAEGSRPDRTGRADQRRMAEGLLPLLLGGRGSAGGVRQTPCSGQLHHCAGSHPRRRRQRIPDAAAVHGRGRRPDRLVRPHLLSASG